FAIAAYSGGMCAVTAEYEPLHFVMLAPLSLSVHHISPLLVAAIHPRSLFSVRTHNIQRILPLRRKRKEDLWFARLSIRCSLPKNFLFGIRSRFTDGCQRCNRPAKKKS